MGMETESCRAVLLKSEDTVSKVVEDLPKLNEKGDYVWSELGFKWVNMVAIIAVHAWGVFALFHLLYDFRLDISIFLTMSLRFVEGVIAGLGVTAGAHRLWCHRAYKATKPLQILLIFFFTMAGQNQIYDWVRDHRVHHKFSETDADPHNANRGLFFSHCGWLMLKKHPEVIKHGKKVDMSDIATDPLITFHSTIFFPLKIIFCHGIPVILPMLLWNENFFTSFNLMILRYLVTLNATWSVNSFAHIYGNKPFNKFIFPGENRLVALMSMGEGFHNYHHVFPWDYKAAELGGVLNPTTFFINTMAFLGLAYDLKQPSEELIKKTAVKYGDGTHLKTM